MCRSYSLVLSLKKKKESTNKQLHTTTTAAAESPFSPFFFALKPLTSLTCFFPHFLVVNVTQKKKKKENIHKLLITALRSFPHASDKKHGDCSCFFN